MPSSREKTPLEKHFEDFHAKNKRASYKIRRPKKRNTDPCTTCLKAALQVFNVIILIIGCGCAAVGIWLLVTEYNLRELAALFNLNLLEIATFLLLGGGCFITVMAICGCCGTMRMDKCIIGFYATVLTLVFFALGVCSVFAFLSRNMIISDVEKKLVATLTEQYGVNLRKSADNRRITDAWDSMQQSLECCGISGNVNDTSSWAMFKIQSQWYNHPGQKNRTPLVPRSCCAGKDYSLCDGSADFNGPPGRGPPMMKGHKVNPELYTEGCLDKAFQYMQTHSIVLGLVAAFFPLCLVAGIVISCCLCFRVPGRGDDDDYDSDEEEDL